MRTQNSEDGSVGNEPRTKSGHDDDFRDTERDPKADLDSWFRKTKPVMCSCKTPDGKRVIGAWVIYDDLRQKAGITDGWSIPQTFSLRPYKIHPIESKGHGMIATRNIKYGELILHELPVIMMPMLHFDKTSSSRVTINTWMQKLLLRLEKDDKEEVLGLSNCKPLDKFWALAGIFFTNAIRIQIPGSQISDHYGAVCSGLSYVNHSCAHNTIHGCDVETLTFTLRAGRDISAGEEITINYGSPELPHAQRKKILRAAYGLECACPRCSAPAPLSDTSDERQKFIYDTLSSVKTMFFKWILCAPCQRASLKERDLEMLHSLLRAMKEENIRWERPLPLEQLVHMYAILGDVKKFKETAVEYVEAMEVRVREEEIPAWRAMWERWLENPTSFPAWGRWAWCSLSLEEFFLFVELLAR